MSAHRAAAVWERGPTGREEFLAGRYSRRHVLRFEGGAELAGSSSPQIVPLPWSDPAGVDPEALFVASLASCHMLWFLTMAIRSSYCIDAYVDQASGVLAKGSDGKLAMTVVTLRPDVTFSSDRVPGRADLLRLHHAAHDECFIASSVRTDVRCEPVLPRRA